jgi:RNA polymerase sigma factor (sigma-70 family)
MRTVIRHLRAAVLLHRGDGPTDGQLLELFLARRDEVAFEALLRRHGPMVQGVCRRVLRKVHDAEDAFQATFLVLARKAACIQPRERVGNWLYGVAYRTAMKARTMNAKRHTKEKQARPAHQVGSEAPEELLEQLDHELIRLPDKYRVPVIFCELEDKSRKEVARLLGVPEGTLSWRLAQAKKILARRLSRYGSVAVATLLAEGAVSACLSPTLRASTVKAALTAGAVPAKVLALTEGVMKAMLLTKLKITVCVAALALLAGVGVTGVSYRATAEEPRKARVEDTPPQTGRSQTDDLASLRLEIEALRKELRATREQVKALEAEVHGQKERSITRSREARSEERSATRSREPQPEPRGRDGARRPTRENPAPTREQVDDRRATRGGATEGPIAEAEAALKKLRDNPNDRQAAEALERALKSLKERERPREPREAAPERRR